MDIEVCHTTGMGFKALVWNGITIVSPRQRLFIWDRSGVQDAGCKLLDSYQDYSEWAKKKMEDAHDFDSCSCGLYGAYDYHMAIDYEERPGMLSCMFLVQPHRRTDYRLLGFRCQSMKVIASVAIDRTGVSAIRGGEYFNIPVIDLRTAQIMVDVQMLAKTMMEPEIGYQPLYITTEQLKEYLDAIQA